YENGGGRNTDSKKRLRMRTPARRGNADHRPNLRHPLRAEAATSGDAGITGPRSESGAAVTPQRDKVFFSTRLTGEMIGFSESVGSCKSCLSSSVPFVGN